MNTSVYVVDHINADMLRCRLCCDASFNPLSFSPLRVLMAT